MTSRIGSARRILGIWKKLGDLRLDTGREGLTFASSRRLSAGVTRHVGGGRWKGQNRKIVPLSPYVEKPLNSKVIKSFVPELRSVFRVSRFLCSIYLSIYIYIYIYMNIICPFRISEYGYGIFMRNETYSPIFIGMMHRKKNALYHLTGWTFF